MIKVLCEVLASYNLKPEAQILNLLHVFHLMPTAWSMMAFCLLYLLLSLKPPSRRAFTMPKRSNAAAALQSSTRGETSFREFANSTLALEQSKQRAAPLLNSKGLLQNVRALAPEDQTKFIDKIDQVCRSWLIILFQYLPSIKAYPTIDSQDTKAVTALGDVCSAIGQLPTSAVISAGLEKHSKIITASGGLADTWRGEYDATQVAIKAFRIYPAQNLKEAKGVSIQSEISEVFSLIEFSDSVETYPDVEETVP